MRKKTLEEISDQCYRLYYENLDNGNRERAYKILRIKERYQDNINKRPEQRELLRYTHNWLRDKCNYEKRINIKYSRLAYAGY